MDSNSKDFAINIENANVILDGVEILHDINLQVPYGQKCFILGANGAGKTTFVKMLLGYVWAKWGSKVEVLGKHFGKTDLNELRKSIAWVSPFINKTCSGNNGVDMVLSGRSGTLGYYLQASEDELNEVADFLKKVDALHLANKEFSEMSSGEQIKILIARALFAKSKLMILDEPTAYLDIAQREFLLKAINKIANENPNLTIIFISQNITDILPIFDKGMILKDGKIMKYGARDEVLTENNLKEIFNLNVKLIKTDNGRLWSIVE
ncbi:MAG: ATP-binding cassette domain-containing protein [Cyanobacteria bacterium SIG30]|nr:ATP-binding cassette domain-containing protein [Cyanobacteria bacterium SIG30]